MKFCSNICNTHWDQHTYAHYDVSRINFGFEFWSGGHRRMAVVHLPIKFGVDVCIQSKVIDIFWNSRWRPPPSWIFSLCEFGHSGVMTVWYCVLYQIWFKYMLESLRSTHICFRHSFDDVTRINFRFRLLVKWSPPHGSDASSHIIWCKISLSSPKLLTFFRN